MSIGELNSPTTLSVCKNAQQLHPLSTPMGEPGKEVGQIDDVFSTHWEKEKPISCGFFTVKAGTPFTYTYGYDELKLVVEGTLILEDKVAGVRIEAHPGDTLSIPKGTPVTFSSPNFAKAFYVGQRAYRDW
ncbi:hypothetical protein JCM3775_003622 [Rhodotorula graminis]|uniref:(S)-ureidoglycine aminohydrolase cupin domain-containing protein n=1 Tax=Rhodotorula graminis (strain WP1) TaxID=578459 RepID=A0A194S1N4_RHOGW|nr:uncharacterized protein RHOBADRAFT_44935 [Rhodotorula graminis WP1]KPV74445.1 hypothetical protein RHOBADRAFT_44935 [Rhodotorula graminis WP1]